MKLRSNAAVAGGVVLLGLLAPSAATAAQGDASNPAAREARRPTPRLTANSVRSPHIARGAVGARQLAPGAVRGPALARGAVGPRHLAPDAVRGAALADGAVGGAKLAPAVYALFPTIDQKAALTGSRGAPSAANPYVTAADPRLADARPPSGGAGGALTGAYPSPALAAGAITSTQQFAAGALPAARVRMHTDGLQAVGNNQPLPWLHADVNVGGVWNIEQFNQLTAPVAGLYSITASVQIANFEGQAYGALELRHGSTLLASDGVPAATGGRGDVSVSTIAALPAGGAVEVYWRGNRPGISVAEAGTSSFTMNWIGPAS